MGPTKTSAYYSVIVGWCLFYLVKSMILPSLPSDEETSVAMFNSFVHESYWPLLTHVLAISIVGACIFGGINWIEKANMVLVPMLLGILIFTFGWSLTRPYAEVGISFLFTPTWSSMFKPSVWVAAASQNAYDTGAAMALFTSYAAYFTRKNGAVRFGTMVPLINNMISLICGMTIFATVFSTLIATSPTLTRSGILKIMQLTGPGSTGLTFTWIPVLFARVGGFGRVLCVLFFLCLSFAGLTSLIAHVQVTVLTAKDLGLHYRTATITGLALTLLFGLPSAFKVDILTNQDHVWGFALILSGMTLCTMVAIYGPMRYRRVVVNDFGIGDWKLPVIWVGMMIVVCPLCGFGLIIWWVYDLVTSNPHWFQFTLDSMTTTLLEWLVLLVILLSFNGLVIWRKPKLFNQNENVGYDPHHPELIPRDQLDIVEGGIVVTPAESEAWISRSTF